MCGWSDCQWFSQNTGQETKQHPEDHSGTAGNESRCGDCERLCTSGDRRDFCAVLGTGHVVLTIDRYARVDAQPRPARAICGGLLDIQKQSMISWPSYSSHCSFLHI